MSFCGIITTEDPRWSHALQRFKRYDFHHLPGYVALSAAQRGGVGRALLLEDDRGMVLVPFIESPIPLSVQPAGAIIADAVSPYGYPGPLVQTAGGEADGAALVTTALDWFLPALRGRGVCALFLRFHPLLLPPLEPFRVHGNLLLHGETVWADLRLSDEAIWSDTRRDFRNPINRVRREGYVFEMDLSAKYLADFVQLYHDTMKRVGAEPEYYFSEQYFHGMKQALGPVFQLALVRSPAGAIVSAGIFTSCTGIVQYHLSGNSLDKEGSDASKLLLHGARQWAKSQGAEQLHLGGGLGGRSDSLFLFKSGLSSQRGQFYTWRAILDEKKYTAANARWERLNQVSITTLGDFFPAYRKVRTPPQPAPSAAPSLTEPAVQEKNQETPAES